MNLDEIASALENAYTEQPVFYINKSVYNHLLFINTYGKSHRRKRQHKKNMTKVGKIYKTLTKSLK